MIIHSPIISGSLTFAEGSSLTLPPSSVYSGSFSGSYQGDTFQGITFQGGTFTGDGSSLTFGGTGIVSSSTQTISNLGGSDIVSSSAQTAARLINQATDFGTGRVSGDNIGDLAGTTTFTGSFVGDGTNLSGVTSYTDSDTLEYINSLGVISGAAQLDGENVDLNIISGSTARISTNFVSEGNTYLGSSGTGSYIYASGKFSTDLIPRNDLGSWGLGSQSNPWAYINVDQIISPFPIISSSAQIQIDSTSGNLTSLGTVTQGSVTAILPSGTVSGSTQVDHDATTNFVANEHIDHSTVSITAGSGLTGGGTIAATRTINVGAGDGISVAADAVSVDATVLRTTGFGVVSGSSQVFSDISGDVLIASNGVATIQANSVALGTDTTGNYVATLGSGTGVTIGSNTGEGSTPTIAVNYGSTANTAVQGNTSLSFAGTSNEITIDGGSSITLGSGGTVTIGLADTIAGNRTFSNNVTITGNLTVNGTTTTVNSNTVNIGDNIIVLNSDVTGTPTQNGGIELERGTSTNASLIWDEGNDYWVAGLAGAEERIVIGAGNTSITTLGTITTGTWNGTAIANAYLANSTISGVSLGSNLNALTIGTGLSGTSYNGSSAVTIANTGVLSVNGVTGAVTATNLLDAIKTVDGAGSGLDADTLDGISSASFLRSNATDTASGIITFSNTTASTSKTTGAVIVTGGVGIGGDLNVGGDVVAYASSDERLKDNIELISNPIEKVQSLKGVTWNWNDNASETQKSTPNVGVIAQDVEKVLPQLVHDRENGFKGVDYAKLTGLLIEAIKEQQKQIDELKSKLG